MGKDQYTAAHTSSFETVGGDIMAHTLRINGSIRMDELMGELERYDAPRDIMFRGDVTWLAPASIDAITKRAENIKAAEVRREEWERQTLATLQAKYPAIESATPELVVD